MTMPAYRFQVFPDPDIPGRCAYRISADTADAVQRMIDRVMNSGDVVSATFDLPKRNGSGFVASGVAVHMPAHAGEGEAW